MARLDPHDQLFKRTIMCDKCATSFIWASAFVSLSLIFLQTHENVIWILNGINCGLIALAILFDLLYNYYFFEAGKARREDFIDNSFKTNFAGIPSEEYFTNDNINPGLYKMAVNCFENSLFSWQISGKMILMAWAKAIVIVVIFVFNAAIGEKNAIIFLIQLWLPVLLIQHAVKIWLFNIRTHNVYKDFLRLFNDLAQDGNINGKDAEILKIVLDYQTIIALGAVQLDSKIFNDNNAQLSQKWNDLKIHCKIKPE